MTFNLVKCNFYPIPKAKKLKNKTPPPNYLDQYFPNAVRKKTPLGRAYYDPTDVSDNPFLALSVTTILGLVLNKGIGFDNWLKANGRFADWIRDYKAHLGTVVHILSESLFLGQSVTKLDISQCINQNLKDRDFEEGGGYSNIERIVRLYLESLCKFYDDNEVETLDTELSLFAKDVPYAGTVDWVGRLNGVPSIIDLKSGAEVDSHEYQLVAYGLLHNYIFPENKVEKLYTLYLKGTYRIKPTYKLAEVSWDLEMDWKRLLRIGLNRYGKKGKWQFPKRFEPREKFKLGDNLNGT